MAGIPFYAQGSQLANTGLFQGQQPLPSSIPSISGQPQQYVPGNGMAPYAAAPTGLAPGQTAASQAMAASHAANGGFGLDAYYKARASSIPSVNAAGSSLSNGTVSMLPNTSQQTSASQTAAPTTQQGNGFTVIGQPGAPSDRVSQLDAQMQAGMTAPPTQGGGPGGMSGQQQHSGTQIPQGLLNGQQNQATPGQLTIGNPPAGTAGSASGPVTTYAPAADGAQPQAGSGSLQMQQQSPQDALAGYKDTAGYQLTNAPGVFQASPGYQFATQDAMRQLQANASAHGLLQSGSALRAATNQAQGMAQQDYSNWWNRQNDQFNAYQNRLAGLAGGNVGGDQAYNNGQSLSAGTTNTGQNIAGLLGNQGAAGYGGLVNTGAAQSSNMGNAATQQAQVNAANQSTQLAGAVYNRGLF